MPLGSKVSASKAIPAITPDGARLNRYGHAANLGEHVKRNEETREPDTHRGLTVDRLFHRVRRSLNVLGVEMIEDVQVLFIASADIPSQDRAIQGALQIAAVGAVYLAMRRIR